MHSCGFSFTVLAAVARDSGAGVNIGIFRNCPNSIRQ